MLGEVDDRFRLDILKDRGKRFIIHRIANAREAALKDPDGLALSRALAFRGDALDVAVRAAE